MATSFNHDSHAGDRLDCTILRCKEWTRRCLSKSAELWSKDRDHGELNNTTLLMPRFYVFMI